MLVENIFLSQYLFIFLLQLVCKNIVRDIGLTYNFSIFLLIS